MVLILRSALFYLGYTVSIFITSILCFVVVWFVPDSRRHLIYAYWCRFTLIWLRLSCGIKYQIHGLENIPDIPVVVLANHQSEWETVFLYSYLAPICPILKKELLNIPFWGWALRLQQPIAIDRSKPHEAGKSILTQGLARIRQGRSVIIFPEGTRTHVDREKKFSRGGAKLAVAANVPILPVAHNAGHCWPPHRFLKYPGTIHVFIGIPINTIAGNASELTDSAETWVRRHIQNRAGDRQAEL